MADFSDEDDVDTPGVDCATSHSPRQVDSIAEPPMDSPSAVVVSAEPSQAQKVSIPASVGNGRVEDGEALGRGKRVKTSLVRLRDFVTNTVLQVSPSSVSLAPPRKSGTPYPMSYSVNCNQFSTGHRNFLAAITAGGEPKSYKEGWLIPNGGRPCSVKSVLLKITVLGVWFLFVKARLYQALNES
ncbi:hypothetical protein LIER_40187 [Lithospermum erythrorhizon]|uniref:Uncharacterized protein n=1 Tax=Lithospermum erythrorhizon TaxID=34254 RepID=A0AAV3QT65_LITER